MRHAALPHSRDMAPQSPAPCPSARQGPAAEDDRMRMLQPTLCLGAAQNTRLQTWQPPGAVPPNEKRFGVCECVCALVCVCVCVCVCTYTPLPGVPTFTPRWRWRGTRWRGRPAKTEGVHIHTYMWIIQQIPGACWQTHAHAPARPTAHRPPCSAEDGKAPRVRSACEQGTRYHGLQMATQPNTPTVEAKVHQALLASFSSSSSSSSPPPPLPLSGSRQVREASTCDSL